MKKRMILGAWLVAGVAAYAQVEVDDMYFNAKDRAKLLASSQKALELREERMNEGSRQELSINPTDSYSARNVNPEYVSRLRTNPSSQQEDPAYFISGYQPTGVNPQFRNTPNFVPGAWGSPFMGSAFYRPGAFGNPYMGWNDPFMGYSAFNDPWLNSPSWAWSMSYGYGWNNWSPWGWNAWNNWGSPSMMFWDSYYYGWNPYMFNNSWGNSFCYSGFYSRYAPPVIIIDADNSSRPRVVYGKRGDRSSALDNEVSTPRMITSTTRTGREISSGRTRENSDVTYYDRSWRRSETTGQSTSRNTWSAGDAGRSDYSDNQNTRQRSASWGNDPFQNNRSNSSRSWSNDNNSGSFNFNSGGNSRSSSGSSGSSGSGGASRSRGRN
jgi:hypothetical protein